MYWQRLMYGFGLNSCSMGAGTGRISKQSKGREKWDSSF